MVIAGQPVVGRWPLVAMDRVTPTFHVLKAQESGIRA